MFDSSFWRFNGSQGEPLKNSIEVKIKKHYDFAYSPDGFGCQAQGLFGGPCLLWLML
jgi:hypothetical protein